MTVKYLFPPPQVLALPLSKGRDLNVDFIYKPLVVDENGDPVLDAKGKKQYAVADYPDGAEVVLTIDTTTPTVVNATITGHHAVVNADFAVADAIDTNVKWRVKLIDGSVDDVLAHGVTARRDST